MASIILFRVEEYVTLNILILIPAVFLGLLCGLLAIVFSICNQKLVRLRKKYLFPKKSLRVLEVVLIFSITISLIFLIGLHFPCTKKVCNANGSCKTMDGISIVEVDVEGFACTGTTYNEFATLFFSGGVEAINHLFSRNTYEEFGFLSILVGLAIYFPLSCWTAGSSISSGLVIPSLFIGALVGRFFGIGVIRIFGIPATDSYWMWIDPGLFSVLGAAAFFGGVSRLTISLAVIVTEITGNTSYLLPVMVAIMVAKRVGDVATHSLYHALLEIRCIPYLDYSLGKLRLEEFTVKDAAAYPVMVVTLRESVYVLANLLQQTDHNGFPVVEKNQYDLNVFRGLLTRGILESMLNVTKFLKQVKTNRLFKNQE